MSGPPRTASSWGSGRGSRRASHEASQRASLARRPRVLALPVPVGHLVVSGDGDIFSIRRYLG